MSTTASISVCRNCGNSFDISTVLYEAHHFTATPKRCPRCSDIAQNRPAEAVVAEREVLAWGDCCTIDLDVSQFVFKQTASGGCWKGTLKQRTPRPPGVSLNGDTQMARIEVYDHRNPEERDRSLFNSKPAHVQVARVVHDAPVTRKFIHHRYELRDGREFERGYAYPPDVAESKGLSYLGPVEVEKTFTPEFVYLDLYPPAQSLAGARLVVTGENVSLHDRNALGEPILDAQGQPAFYPQPCTVGSILSAWELLWQGDFLALYQTDIFARVSALYAEHVDTLGWYVAAIAAYDDVVFGLSKAGTLPPNAEKRWEKIAKLRAQAASTTHGAEALTALRIAIKAMERLTGFEPEGGEND